MADIIQFIQNTVDVITSIVDVLINIVMTSITFFKSLANGVLVAMDVVSYLPAPYIGAFYALIAFSVISLIIGISKN